MALVVAERGLEDWRDGAEEVADAGHGLQPHCGDEDEPSVGGEGPEPVGEHPHRSGQACLLMLVLGELEGGRPRSR